MLLNDDKIPEESDIIQVQKEESKAKDNHEDNIIENDSEEEVDDGKLFDWVNNLIIFFFAFIC